MAHTRKSDGQRKDKQNEAMREAVSARKHEHKEPTKGLSDQGDVRNFKPGGEDDSTHRKA